MTESQTGKSLAKRWGLDVRQALYRETGNWYHCLTRFPGALLDKDGYVIFDNEAAFKGCQKLQIGKEVGAPKGIKDIPHYRYFAGAQSDSSLVDSFVRPRALARGQAWGGSAEGRRAIETYAMSLAQQHYRRFWSEVTDVSAHEPYDLLCRDGDRELHVEVKGTTSLGEAVLLTRNEVRHAEGNIGRVALFVVSNIRAVKSGCAGGTIRVLEPWDICEDKLEPITFECWSRDEVSRVPAPETRAAGESKERRLRGRGWRREDLYTRGRVH